MQGVVIVAALTVALLENLLFCWGLCKEAKGKQQGAILFRKVTYFRNFFDLITKIGHFAKLLPFASCPLHLITQPHIVSVKNQIPPCPAWT